MWLMLCAWRWKSAPPGETNRCESHKSIPTIGKQNKKKILFFRVGVLSAFRYLSQLCLASHWKFIKVFAVQWIRLIFRHIYCVHCLEVLGGIKIGSKSAINKYSLGRKYWKTIAQTFRASVESCFEANWSWPSCGYILPANITTRAASSWVSERRRSCIRKLVSLSFFWNIFVTSILLIFSRVNDVYQGHWKSRTLHTSIIYWVHLSRVFIRTDSVAFAWPPFPPPVCYQTKRLQEMYIKRFRIQCGLKKTDLHAPLI